MNLNSFSKKGIITIRKALPKKACENVISLIEKNRNWDQSLFLEKKDFLKQKTVSKLNPGKKVQNLYNKINLSFIEKNTKIKQTLKTILGQKYNIILAKFVVSVPNSWMPKYVKDFCKKNPGHNLNKFIKKKYRNVTFFQGLNFHMDSIDRSFKSNKFITMYIYLNKVSADMSPIELVQGSHKFGHVPWPHFIRRNKKKKLEFSVDNKNFHELKKQVLFGSTGDVFIWTSNTLHGTSKPNNKDKKFRISLRYLIEKKSKKESLIDKVVLGNKVSKGNWKKNYFNIKK